MITLATVLVTAVLSAPCFAGSSHADSGKVNVGDVMVVKRADKSTPILYVLLVVIP
jgi:type VI protein secretion system component Hcp